MRLRIIAFLFIAASGSWGLAPLRAEDAVMKAMGEEMSRSFQKLRHAEKVPLYFLLYEVRDVRWANLGASHGALTMDSENNRARYLDVDARVGSRHIDNTHQIKGAALWDDVAQDRAVHVPIEDDVDALREVLWSETDFAYKAAQERYTKVSTNHAVTAKEEDPSDDFSAPVRPVTYRGSIRSQSVDLGAWKERIRRLSAHFMGHALIYDSSVQFLANETKRWFLTSEGTRIEDAKIHYDLYYDLSTHTEDGMALNRFKHYFGFRPEDMPSDETVLRDMDQSMRELKSLRKSPVIQPYSGPVILKNRAAGVYFHEILGHRLEGQRQKNESEGQTFAKKLGQPIVSPIISVYDDPTQERFRGEAIESFYRFDEEGVPAQRTVLIQNGILRGFLMGRSPIAVEKFSNGHGRRQMGFPIAARMGTLFVESSQTVPYARLREMLIAEIQRQHKPFGFIIDDIAGGFTPTGRSQPQSFKVEPLLVYRIYPDGRPDETVRGVDIVGTPLASFSRILAAADDAAVDHGFCGAESGMIPHAIVSPSILVSEMEVEKKQKSESKPPILPPPF